MENQKRKRKLDMIWHLGLVKGLIGLLINIMV